MSENNEFQEMLSAMKEEQSKGKKTFWTPKDGKNTIRFIPRNKKMGEKLPYMKHLTHWIDGKPFECLNQGITDKNGKYHEPEECPACKLSKKLHKISEDGSEERELAYNLMAKERYVWKIVVRGKEDETDVEFYETGVGIYKKIFAIFEGGDYGNFFDPIEGRDWFIVKEGKGRTTKYDSSMPSVKESKIFEDKEKMIQALTKANELKYSSLIEMSSADAIQNAIDEFLNGGKEEEVKQVKAEEPIRQPKQAASPVKHDLSSNDDDDSGEDVDSDQIDDILKDFQ